MRAAREIDPDEAADPLTYEFAGLEYLIWIRDIRTIGRKRVDMSIPGPIETIQFRDIEADDDAIVIVRRVGTRVALALSFMKNGDLETFMDSTTAARVARALAAAVHVKPPQEAPSSGAKSGHEAP